MDYTQFAPAVLAVCGTFLQWIRQYKKNSEWLSGAIAFVLGTGVYLVVHPLSSDWRLEILYGFLGIAGYTSSVLGGTYIAARTANAGVAFVPITNSK